MALLLIPIEHVLANQVVWVSWLSEVSFSRYEVLFEFVVVVVVTPISCGILGRATVSGVH